MFIWHFKYKKHLLWVLWVFELCFDGFNVLCDCCQIQRHTYSHSRCQFHILIWIWSYTSVCQCETKHSLRFHIQHQNIAVWSWSSKSSGLNVIEHIWDELKWRVLRMSNILTSMGNLWKHFRRSGTTFQMTYSWTSSCQNTFEDTKEVFRSRKFKHRQHNIQRKKDKQRYTKPCTEN
jgi:hypothetical protein